MNLHPLECPEEWAAECRECINPLNEYLINSGCLNDSLFFIYDNFIFPIYAILSPINWLNLITIRIQNEKLNFMKTFVDTYFEFLNLAKKFLEDQWQKKLRFSELDL